MTEAVDLVAFYASATGKEIAQMKADSARHFPFTSVLVRLLCPRNWQLYKREQFPAMN